MRKRSFSLLEKWLLIPAVWVIGFPILALIVGEVWTTELTTKVDDVETAVEVGSPWGTLAVLAFTIFLTVKIAGAPRKGSVRHALEGQMSFDDVAHQSDVSAAYSYPKDRMTGLEKVFGVSTKKKQDWKKAVGIARREKLREAEMQELNALAEQHKAALLRNWHKHVQVDEYGTQHLGQWSDEVQRFLMSVGFDPQVLEPEFAMVFVTDFVETHASGSTDYSVFDLQEVNDAWEFEQLCAEELNGAGWSAKVTQGSGDQGIDVLAAKDGVTVVIQCKLYGKPVGNKAVQEAISGKTYEKADYAAVVAPNGYTSSARALAQRADVLLLSPKDLRHLELHLGR